MDCTFASAAWLFHQEEAGLAALPVRTGALPRALRALDPAARQEVE